MITHTHTHTHKVGNNTSSTLSQLVTRVARNTRHIVKYCFDRRKSVKCWIFYVWRAVASIPRVEMDRCRLRNCRRNTSLQHKMDSLLNPSGGSWMNSRPGSRGWWWGFNSPACMFMSNVLSPTGGIDHRCHIWQWLTAPVIAMFALGEERTTTVGPCVWRRAGVSQSHTSPALVITS